MPSEKEIIDILFKNRNIKEIVNGSPFSEGINWYLAGGCIHQTIWNHLLGNNSEHGIIDYDLVYYDSHDLSEESERNNQARINKIFKSLGAEIEVVNEARVHLWKKDATGDYIKPYKSCEDAISTWLTTVTPNGITKQGGTIKFYSTFGFEDVFKMTVHPNKRYADKRHYNKKITRWQQVWPGIKIEVWE